MSRARKQDAWQASVRISIPINATDPSSIARAQESVTKLATLIPGSAVEIMHAGFGRMAAPVITPRDLLNQMAPREAQVPALAMSEIAQAIGAAGDDIPESLRRVPRHNGGTPMDPAGDGSFRGPDGAA